LRLTLPGLTGWPRLSRLLPLLAGLLARLLRLAGLLAWLTLLIRRLTWLTGLLSRLTGLRTGLAGRARLTRPLRLALLAR
jgi:hypothetical protein